MWRIGHDSTNISLEKSARPETPSFFPYFYARWRGR
jgi:hypothetical protein